MVPLLFPLCDCGTVVCLCLVCLLCGDYASEAVGVIGSIGDSDSKVMPVSVGMILMFVGGSDLFVWIVMMVYGTIISYVW